MTARSAFRLGQGIGTLVAIAIVVFAFAWDDVVRWTADETGDHFAAWFYDTDAAEGEVLDARVRVDSGQLTGVRVYAHDDEIGGTIVRGPSELAASLLFEYRVPAEVGETLELTVAIHTTRGETIRFPHRVTVISRTASALRRLAKGGLALALFAAATVLVFALKRRALRRGGQESPLWLVPVVLIGAVSFVPLAEQATRGNGPWFFAVMLAGWAAAGFALAERLNRRIGLAPYTAVPMLVDMEGHEAFRDPSVRAPIRPIADLENAWSAIGLLVRRAGRELIVTGPGGRIAVVPVPASELVGGGPLVVRASEPEFADLLIAAASDVLGELRFA